MSEKTKVVGVSFDGRQPVIGDINEIADKLVAVREPENPYDSNAIGVYVKKFTGEQLSIGYINRGLAAQIAPLLDADQELIITDYFITGSREKGRSLGVLFEYELVDKLQVAQR